MSRRRKKNPLLMRIVGVTIVIHAIALPIAAHFGAFEKIKQQFGQARVVLLPPPKQDEKEQAKEKKAKPKVDKSKGKASVKRGGPAKTNPNRQKVVAASPSNDTGQGEGPVIEQGTQTNAGVIPTEKPGSGSPKSETSNGSGGGAEAPTTPKTKTETSNPSPPITNPTVVPEKAKHTPVYADVQQDYSPQPEIPDDLRNEPLEKDFVALFTVGPDGIPTDVKMTQSTGSSELDAIALKTARKWRFKPASLDGSGVESKVKLTIQFRVE